MPCHSQVSFAVKLPESKHCKSRVKSFLHDTKLYLFFSGDALRITLYKDHVFNCHSAASYVLIV